MTTDTTPLLPPPARSEESRRLVLACALTTFFFIVELVGGYFASSLAIMSDAAHLLSDLAAFAISLTALAVAALPASPALTFGYARAEVLGALVSVALIWALTAALVVFAIARLFNPTPVNGPLMLILGIIGLVVNVALATVLGHPHHHGHDHDHDHDHGHDHGHYHSHDHHHHHHHEHDEENGHPLQPEHTSVVSVEEEPRRRKWLDTLLGRDIDSLNVRAAYLHALGDLAQSVGVIVAAIVICVDSRLSFVDPICTLVFAALAVATTAPLARESLAVLMEAAPPRARLADLHARLMGLSGVRRVTDLHVWSISSRSVALSAHVLKDQGVSSHDLLTTVQAVLKTHFGIVHATIQINCHTPECACHPPPVEHGESPNTRSNCVSFE